MDAPRMQQSREQKINPDDAKRRGHERRRRKVAPEREDREPAPDRTERDVEPAQPLHPQRMDEENRQEGERDEGDDDRERDARLGPEQKQIKGDQVPGRRKAAEIPG